MKEKTKFKLMSIISEFLEQQSEPVNSSYLSKTLGIEPSILSECLRTLQRMQYIENLTQKGQGYKYRWRSLRLYVAPNNEKKDWSLHYQVFNSLVKMSNILHK